jgi:hypothetical protein
MIEYITDSVIYIDVDETLIIPAENCFVPHDPNLKLIEKIKEWKDNGRQIIVWTSNGNGVRHAINVVKSLGLEDYVDICLPKPRTIVDDDHLEYYNIIDPITLEWVK